MMMMVMVTPTWPKMAPREPKMAPRWAPKGPKRSPKAVQNRSSNAFQHRNRKRECADQSEIRIWAVLGPVLGPIWGLYWAPGFLFRRFKTIKIRNRKCSKYIVNYRSEWPSGGPREVRVGVILGSSWHLKGILTRRIITLATKVDIRGGGSFFGGGRPGPGGPWGGGLRGRDY